jgi:hypothetical protein
VRAATRAADPTRPASGSGTVGAGPCASEGGGNIVKGDETGGFNQEEKPVAGARRRFSAGVPVPGGWGGGEAWVGVGVMVEGPI